MNHYYLLAIVFLCFPKFTFAQDQIMKFEKGTSFVISTTGLNLRTKPNLKSKIITKIDYGEQVEILEKKFFGIDTIGSYKVYNEDDFKEIIIPVIGNWVEVKYKNRKGFLFDAYLYRSSKEWDSIKELKDSNLNKDFVLLFPGTFCNYNYWFQEDLNWYGVYGNKEYFKIEKLELSFYKDWNGELADMGISTNKNKGLLFIIGSKNRINEKRINGLYQSHWNNFGFSNVKEIQLSRKDDLVELHLFIGNKKQDLNPFEKEYSPYPRSVVWKGDLDGDEKADYIIRFGEKSAKTILYLSSQAESTELVKPVAVFFSGYCC